MKVQSVKMRSNHPNTFRPGEWAEPIGIAMVTPPGAEPRMCYVFRYEDGVVDYKPCRDEDNRYYEAMALTTSLNT